jgi:purine-binding chemotaxis protein CheW
MSGLHVRVRVANEEYALPVADVLEVAELGDVAPLPGAGPAVLGVRNLRGQVLPVVDLATVFGLARAMAPRAVVIAEQGGRKAGLAVESVAGVEVLPDASEEVEARHLARAALADGALVGVVDVGSVLDAVEGVPST